MSRPKKPLAVGDRVLVIWTNSGFIELSGIITFMDPENDLVRIYGKFKPKGGKYDHVSKISRVHDFTGLLSGKIPMQLIPYR